MGSIRDRLKEIADSGSTTPISAQKAYKPAGTMNPGRLYSGKKEEEDGLDTASARARQLVQARRAAMERANERAQEIREKRTVRDLGTGSAREERLKTSQQAAASRLHAENRRANAGFTTFARGNAVTQTSEMDTGRALAEGLNRSGMDMQTRGEAAAESQRRASELQKQLTNQEKVLQNVYDAYMKAPSEELYNGYQNLYKRYENTKQAYALYAEKYQKDAQGYREAEKFYALMQQEAEKQQRKQDAEMGVETGEDGKRRIVDFEKYNAAAGINPETLYTGADARAADEALEPYAKQMEYWQRNGTKDRKTQQAVQNSMNALKDAYIDNPQATTAQRDKARKLLAQMDALENIGNADTLTYTAAQLPLGMEGQIRGVTSLAGTAIGDLATGGKTSDDFKALTDFLAANPAYEKLVFESGTAADFVARKAGVSPASVKAYREANVNAYNTQKVSDYYEGVSDTYKETAGRMAYSVGQQLPSMLLTMGGGEMIGNISQRAATGAITEAAAKAQMAAVEALSKSISVGLMSVGAAGNTLTERANESGYSLANYAYAAATGATEAATEYMLGTTGDVASYQLKVRGVRELFQNALEEGIEEMLGYPIESAADWLFASSKSVDEWVDKITKNSVLDKMSVKEWLQSGIEGFAVGGLMGVSGLVLNRDSGDYDSTGFDRKIKGYAGRESVDYFADMADMEQLNARYEQLRAVYGTQGTDPDTQKMARINNQYISRVGYTAMRAYMEKNGIDMTPAREKLVQVEQKKSASETETQEKTAYTEQEANQIRHEGKTFRNIIAGIDEKVSEFFSKWKNGRKSHEGEKLEKLYLGKLSAESLGKVRDILQYDIESRDVIVTNDDVKHISDGHGDLEEWVYDFLPEVIANPDNITKGHKGTGKNRRKTGILFEKTTPDGRVVSVQVDNPGRGTMQVTTLYVKKESATSEVNAGIPADTRTFETSEPALSNTTIPQGESGVKGNYARTAQENTGTAQGQERSAVNAEQNTASAEQIEPEAQVKLRSDTDVNLTTYAQDLNAKRAAALRRRVADAEAEIASPYELGVVQGETETRNRIVPESIAARDADLQEAREILNGAGYTDTGFVTGQIERYGGTDHYALTKDGKALIQADSVWYTPQELAQTFVQQYGEKKGAKGNEKEQVSLYDRNAGRRGTEPGRKRAERVSETERLRGGTREHREAADQRRRAVAGQPEISPAEAGVPYGAENSRCQIQPESTWDAEQQAAAEYAYSKGVRTVVYLIGDMQVEYEGATEIIEGAWDAQTRTLYVRADSLSRSVSETVEHEAAHAMITQENVERFMTLVKQKKTAAWSALYAAYEKRYRSFTDGLTAEEKGLYIWEEILADAYSETNRYGVRAGTFAAQADEAMEGAREVQAGAEIESQDGKNRLNDGGEQYSAADTAGDPAQADEQIVRSEIQPVKGKFSAADTVPEYLHEMDEALRESSAVNYTPGTLETLLEKKGLTAEEIEASGIMDIAEDALHQTGRPVGTIDAEALKEYVRIKMNAYRKYTETGIHPATETEMRNAELKARRKLRSELLGLFPVQQQNRAEVSQALEDFANWYMSGGERIDKDALWSHKMALFDTLWKSAREMDESGTEVYGPAATMMRGMKLDVPESVRADFGDDWGDVRRALFGVGIYTTKKGGLPLDSAYAELSAVHPGFFDEHELDGKAQLEKILEIAQEARPRAMTLEETARRNGVDVNAMMSEYLMGTTVAVGDYMTALGNMRESWKTGVPTGMSIDDYLEYRDRSAREDAQARAKTIARENFRATPAMDRLGIRIDNSVTDYGQAMALKELNRARRQAEQKAQKEAERRGATRAERQAARAIARGDMRLTDYRFGGQLKQETVKALSELYAAVESFNADAIAAHKRGVKEQLREQMGKLIGKQLPRKKLGMAAMNYMTPKRIMAELFGDAGGKQVYDEVFRSVARNGGEMIRWVQGQKDKVKRFEGADGKARKLSAGESRIVQMMMEGRGARDSAAKLHEGVRDNILNAAADIYGKLRALNENKRSYKKAAQAAMDDARAEYGLNADELRLAYQASRMNEAETLVKELGLDAVKLQNAVNTYREMFDGYYDAINDFLVVHGYEPIGFVKGYTPHMQSEESLGALTKALQLLGGTEDVSSLPVDIAGLTQDFKPGKKYDPYFLQRTGVLSSYDIQAAFDSYLDYLGQVFFRTDDIMRVRALSSYIRENYAPESLRDILDWDASLGEMPAEVKRDWLEEQGAIARDSQMTDEEVNEKFDEYREQITEDAAKNSQYGNLVMWLDNYANILAGKQSAADRGNEQLLGRRTANIANKMTGMTGAALVGANMSSVLNQTSQLAFILGENRTSSVVKALGDMMTRRTRGWDVQSDFLAGKDGVDLLAKDAKGMLDESLFSILTLSDRLVATLAVRTRYIEEIRKGADAETAMNRADDWARDMMGSRMKGERPLAFESKRPLVRAVNMFQTEVLNSWEHVALDLPQEIRDIERTRGRKKAALAAANLIIKTLISAFVMNRLADELYGGTPAMFDVIGLSGLFVASGQGMTENDWIRRVIDNGLENLGAERIFGTARGEDKDFNWKAAREDTFYNITNDLPLVRNVAGLLGWGDETLPTMQLDELLDYVRDMIAGATAGNLRGVTDSAVGLLSNVIPGGRQLQKTYQGARIMAEGGRYKGKNDSLQLMYPVDATVTDWVKALLFGRAGVNAEGEYWASGEKALSTGQTELYREMVGKGADGQEVYSVILDWRAAANDKELNSAERGKREREALKQADLTDGEKLEMYRGLANADSRSEDFRKIMDTGVSFNRTMELYDAYKALYDREDMTAGEKATEFAVWLDGQDYDTAQKTEIRDVLKYYSMVPAEAGRYDKLTDAGLGVEAAERMTKALAALEPEEGKENVSVRQQYRAVLDSDLSDGDKAAAIGTLMDSTDEYTEKGELSQWGKFKKVLDSGLTLEDWYDMYTEEQLDNFCRYMDEGISGEAAMQTAEALDELKDQYEGTDENPKDIEKWRAIALQPYDEFTKSIVLEKMMDEGAYAKYRGARDAGMSTWQYVDFKDQVSYLEADKDANGKTIRNSLKNKVVALIDSMDISGEAKDYLYLNIQKYAKSGLGSTPWH